MDDSTTATRSASTRRDIFWCFSLLGILMAITAVVFTFTDLDMKAARFCWNPNPRPVEMDIQIAGEAVHDTVPVLSYLLAACGIGFLVISIRLLAFRPYRIHAVFFLLTMAIGPGLMVNTIMKPVFGRPRPYQIEQFGGPYKYRAAIEISRESEGSSFPCGDSSVGYALAAFYLVFLRRRKWLAWFSLSFAILLGSGIGYARMAIGRHFLSDVIWSAWIVFLAALVLYYFVLRIPQKESSSQPD